MKVLIMSMPRCYTKSIQTLVSRCLRQTQLRAKRLDGKGFTHLQELLHFNEIYIMGRNAEQKMVVRTSEDQQLQHFRPVMLNADSYGYEEWPATRPIPLDYWHYLLHSIRVSNRDCVLKFFPFKFRTSTFGWSPEQVRARTLDLLSVFDVVIPVVRRDVEARLTSMASAMVYGWERPYIAADAKLISPTKQQSIEWIEYEMELLAWCSELGLPVVASEDFLYGQHRQVLAGYGIECPSHLQFPNDIEYTTLKA